MPNIRMLQAARELAEKEKLVHQGKVQARRRQETDTKDVADKTNKSEIARTIKKGEQDKRSASNELALATKKEANAQAQKIVGAIGAALSVGMGIMKIANDMNKADKQDKKNEAGKLGDQNKKLDEKNKGMKSENTKLQAENKKLEGSTNPKDKDKITANEAKIKSNEGKITANEKTIASNKSEISKLNDNKPKVPAGDASKQAAPAGDTKAGDKGTSPVTAGDTKAGDKGTSPVTAGDTKAGATGTQQVEGGASGGGAQQTGDGTQPATKDTSGATATPEQAKTTDSSGGTSTSGGTETRSVDEIKTEQKELLSQLWSGEKDGKALTEDQKTQIKAELKQNEKALDATLSTNTTSSRADAGIKGAEGKMGEARGNLELLKKAKETPDKLDSTDKSKLEAMGVKAGDDGKYSSASIESAGLVQATNLADAAKSKQEFESMGKSNLGGKLNLSGGLSTLFATITGNQSMLGSLNNENLNVLDRAKKAGGDSNQLSDQDKQSLSNMGLKADSSGKYSMSDIDKATQNSLGSKNSGMLGSVVGFLSGGDKSRVQDGFKALGETKEGKEDQALIADVIGSQTPTAPDPTKTGTTASAQTKSTGLGQSAGSTTQTTPQQTSTQSAAQKLGDFASSGFSAGAKQKFDTLDPHVKALIDNGDGKGGSLTFDKKTGEISAKTGGIFGIGGSTDKIMNALGVTSADGKGTINPTDPNGKKNTEDLTKTDPAKAEAAGKTIATIGKTDPAAAGQILSEIQQKDPVAFKAITAGMNDEQIGKAIGSAVDSGLISADDGKKMIDGLGTKNEKGEIVAAGESRSEGIMKQVTSSNINAADKLYDAGAKTSDDDFAKIGGAKGQSGGSSSSPSTLNSALLLLNMAGPAIQMYLQALDKIREAQEQQLEAMKKYAAAKKMVDTLRGDLKRLEGDGQSGGGGMQGAQAGTGGAR